MNQPVSFENVAVQIASIMQRTQGMDPKALLAGEEFLALDKNFDSLSMVEVQLMIEEAFDIEFDQKAFSDASKMPVNLPELARIVFEQIEAQSPVKASA